MLKEGLLSGIIHTVVPHVTRREKILTLTLASSYARRHNSMFRDAAP